MAKKQKSPAKKPARKPVEEQVDGPIILEDSKGGEHEFELIQLFAAGKSNFALLHPILGDQGDLLIQKLSLTKDGAIQGFADPSKAELKVALKELEAQSAEAGECECECDCCQEMPEHEPAKKKGAKKAEGEEETVIVLSDDEGVDHEFALEELFRVGKKNFAVLRPVEDDGTKTILKFTLDKNGDLEGFEDATDAEFKLAVKDLESRHGAECECECDCCQEPHEPAPKKAAKKTAKKASAKKTSAEKPAAKTASAKKPAAKKPAKKAARK